MYKVIYNYGAYENWSFDDKEFESAETALEWAIHSGHSTEFIVVKIVKFVEDKQ